MVRRLRFRHKTIRQIALAVLFALVLAFLEFSPSVEETSEGLRDASSNASALTAEVFVIDGDTLRVGDVKVRLAGLAAPEKHEPGGAEATEFMRRKLNGRVVRCELDGEKSYDRLIGRCYLDGADVAALLVSEGLARDCPRYSGGRYSAFERAEAALLPLPGYCRPR